MSDPIKLSWADHVLIHACGALLADRYQHDHDGMIQSILTDILPDVTQDNPALAGFIAVARELASAPPDRLDDARFRQARVLHDYHLRRMALAWEQIREQYHDDIGSSQTPGCARA